MTAAAQPANCLHTVETISAGRIVYAVRRQLGVPCPIMKGWTFAQGWRSPDGKGRIHD
jgi:hypothetical protein